MLDLDELEAFYPDLYQDFIDAQRQVWVKDGMD
jgi:hypothetical protein